MEDWCASTLSNMVPRPQASLSIICLGVELSKSADGPVLAKHWEVILNVESPALTVLDHIVQLRYRHHIYSATCTLVGISVDTDIVDSF